MCMFAFRHYGYPHLPQEVWGDVYGMAGALCLLAVVALLPVWWGIKVWVMAEELLTAGCTAAYLAWPQWFVYAFAEERCSQATGFKVGAIGLVGLALVVYSVNLQTLTGSKEEKGNRK